MSHQLCSGLRTSCGPCWASAPGPLFRPDPQGTQSEVRAGPWVPSRQVEGRGALGAQAARQGLEKEWSGEATEFMPVLCSSPKAVCFTYKADRKGVGFLLA